MEDYVYLITLYIDRFNAFTKNNSNMYTKLLSYLFIFNIISNLSCNFYSKV